MLIPQHICTLNPPHIRINLCHICAAIGSSVPTCSWIIGKENHIAPTIENPHFKRCGINADTLREEIIIIAIAIRSKCVGHKQGRIRPDTNRIGSHVNAAIGTGNR